MDKLARLYVQNVVRLHGVPLAIISDRDSSFTSRFWQSLQKEMGMELKFGTSFHPQTNGQFERTNQILKDMLRACVLEFKGSWVQYLPLIEFSYNNSYQATIEMLLYEAIYGRKYQSPLYWDNVDERQMLGPKLIQDTREKVMQRDLVGYNEEQQITQQICNSRS
jgi:transposase InsO family protein